MDSSTVFSGPVTEADMVKLYLEGHGVLAWLDGEALGTWAPHYASGGGAMAVKVEVSPSNFSRATELLKQMNNEGDGPHQSPWKCAQCAADIEGQFTQCWNCNTVRNIDEQ